MHKFSTAVPQSPTLTALCFRSLDYAKILYCSAEITRCAAPPALHSVGLLNVLKSTFAGASGYPLAGRAPVGAAGFSLRARGLKPTALFSGAFAAS